MRISRTMIIAPWTHLVIKVLNSIPLLQRAINLRFKHNHLILQRLRKATIDSTFYGSRANVYEITLIVHEEFEDERSEPVQCHSESTLNMWRDWVRSLIHGARDGHIRHGEGASTEEIEVKDCGCVGFLCKSKSYCQILCVNLMQV